MCTENAFHSIGIVFMYQSLANLNVDNASVNTGVHGGLGVKMKESAPWINVINCLNLSLELTFKDAFDKTFLNKVKKYDHPITKPYKSHGTRWIAHKVKAMEIVLNNYGVYIKHLESLAHTDSQALKQVEIVGEATKWKNAKFPIHVAIYIDVLTPLKVLSLWFQKKIHDPVVAIRRIR